MSNIQTVKTQIQTLIDNANATTGNTDTDLTTAVNSLIEKANSGGGGEVETYGFDLSDENLKYFIYHIDTTNKAIILHQVLYDKIYEATGSYDVTIPDTIGNYKVLIYTI